MTTVTMPRRAWVEQGMGLPVSIHLRGPAVRQPWTGQVVAAVYDELRAVDALFSTYREDSEVSRVNQGRLCLADAHPMLREVAALCELARERTDGCFDAQLPDPRGGIRWDPSGVVKGWGTERAAAHLARIGGHDVSVNAGGDVALVPGRPDSTPWRIGIDDPDRPGRVLSVVAVSSGGGAAPGPAAGGRRIPAPRRGVPADALRAATVVGPHLLWADVYATAAVVRGPGAAEWLPRPAGHAGPVVE